MDWGLVSGWGLVSLVPPVGGGSVGVVPHEGMHLTLPGPIIGGIDQSCPHWILPHVAPLLKVALPLAKLAVKEVLLPDWFFVRPWPRPRDLRPPVGHPVRYRDQWDSCRRAKEVKVVRHHNVASYQPIIRPLPFTQQCFHRRRAGQQQTPVGHDLRDIEDD